MTLNPYLNFDGNTEEAFHFYKSVFGGEFIGGIHRFKDSPEGADVPSRDKDKIMHIALPIGKGNMLMGTDVLESMRQKLTTGNNFSLSIHVDSAAEADKLFRALSDGGAPTMPMEQTSWGYFGMCTDKFGIQWMVNHDSQQE